MKGILLAIGFLITQNAFSYGLSLDIESGFYWSTFPIPMTRFVVDEADASDLQEIVDQAENEWETALGMDIWNISNVQVKSQYSGNSIRWSDNFEEETGRDGQTTLAITVRHRVGTFFTKTEIILNAGLEYLKNNTGGTLKKTILHELGHTIGLDHSQEHAIMQAFIGGIDSLQDDDIAGGNAVMDIHLERQEAGFVSSEAFETESDDSGIGPSCGTIDTQGPGNGNGLANLFSLLLGILLIQFAKTRTFLPIRIRK